MGRIEVDAGAPGEGGGGGRLGLKHVRICVSKVSEGNGSFFGIKGKK